MTHEGPPRHGEAGPREGPGDLAPAEEDAVAAELRRANEELAQRAERIAALSEELRATKTELSRTSSDLAALRRRRVVRAGLAASSVIVAARNAARRGQSRLRELRSGALPARGELRHRLRATPAEEVAFRERLEAALRPSATTGGPLVSIVVLTRDGLGHLERLIPSLEALAYRDLELIVVDNASRDRTVAWLRGLELRFPLRLISNDVNRSFSQANNQAIAVANGELVLLLNNDTEPGGPHVLGHMVERLAADRTIAAVASRLVYPRRTGPRMGPASVAPDLTLQHRAVAFVTDGGVPLARNIGGGEDPLGPEASEAREVQAATAACLLVRRAALDDVGGFELGYDYGMEDVDLCLKLREAGGRIVYEPQATFWHHESATQRSEAMATRGARQAANRTLLADRWGPRIARQVLLDKLRGGRGWAAGPLHVGITLTRDDPAAGWGDWYTAHELGDALLAIGWRVSYLERHQDRWYEPDPSVDVVIALLDALDVRRLPEGVVRVAWVRNWTDRWLSHPWFDEYDIVLASSQASKAAIDAGSVHVAGLMPLATNPDRFRPPEPRPAPELDVVFTTNRWGQARGVESVVPRLTAAGRRVAVYGNGWDKAPAMAGVARGPLAYEDLPGAYARASLVIDDTATPTLPWGAVNSRVFDALATGTLVVTDNVAGARELFGEDLPAATDPDGLARLAEQHLADPEGSRRLAERLRAVVLERHTYARRAVELREALTAWAGQPRIDVAISPPNWDVAPKWGDYNFGRALQRALHRHSVRTRLLLAPAWDTSAAGYADVTIGIFGLSTPRIRQGQLSVLWIISHPDDATDEVVAGHDVVFVASDMFAEQLSRRAGIVAIPLHQATDQDRFRPTPGGPRHELLFVANSRGVRRRVIDDLAPIEHDLAVYGRSWTPDLIDPRHVLGEHIPNEELPAYYSAAAIVLNDHWLDMADLGFMSNRLYDAAACGAFVVSDHVVGIEDEFDGGIATFTDATDLRATVDRFLADPDARAEHAKRARAAVLARHTFGHRVEEILRTIGPILAERPARITHGPRPDITPPPPPAG